MIGGIRPARWFTAAAALGVLATALGVGIATPAGAVWESNAGDVNAQPAVQPASSTPKWMIPTVRSVNVTASSSLILASVTVATSKKLRNQRLTYLEVRGGGS